MSSPKPYIGCRIGLISKAQNRYEGILYTIDKVNSTVVLAKVKCFGTEGRPTERPTAPKDDIYEFITFRGSDIKDIALCEPPRSFHGPPPDPAIVQSSGACPPSIYSTLGPLSPLPAYNQLPASSLFNQQYAAALGLGSVIPGLHVRRGPMVEKAVQTQHVDTLRQNRTLLASPKGLEQRWERRQPERIRGEPFQPRGEPFQPRGGPFQSRGELLQSRREPFQSRREPFQSRGEPLQSRGEPLQSRGEPLQSRGGPLQSRGELLQSRREPFQSRGELLQSRGELLQSRREPLQSRREPLQSRGEPFQSRREPLQSRGEPFQSRREPLQSRGGRFQSRGEGFQSRGEGFQSRGERFQSRGEGFQSRGEGFQSRGEGFQSRGEGFQSRGEGFQSRGEGFQSRGEGFQSRGRPFQSRGGGFQSRGSIRTNMGSGSDVIDAQRGTQQNDENRPPRRQGPQRRRVRSRGQLMVAKVPSATLKFDTDFDFDSSNAQFIKEELERREQDRLDIKDGNHEVGEKQNDNTHLSAEDEDSGPKFYYDKAKSFFDNISSDNNFRLTWAQERKRNLETFGAPGRFLRGQGFRGGYTGQRDPGFAHSLPFHRPRNGPQ